MIDNDVIINDSFLTNDYVERINKNCFVLSMFGNKDIGIGRFPKSLFKYYPNNDYSLGALSNNTVYLNSSDKFNDPYDCNLLIDKKTFKRKRLKFYANFVEVKLTNKDLNFMLYELSTALYLNKGIFFKNVSNLTEIEKINLELFEEKVKLNLNKFKDWNKAIDTVIDEEYNRMKEISNEFRITCFTRDNDNMLMWSHYANNHKGFCIEYDLSNIDCQNDIFHNLFPVIYCRNRLDITNIFLKPRGQWGNNELWELYKNGFLRKDLTWKYEKEYRLIMEYPDNPNIEFLPIKALYCGCRMNKKEKDTLFKIVNEKGIKCYYGQLDDILYKIKFHEYKSK